MPENEIEKIDGSLSSAEPITTIRGRVLTAEYFLDPLESGILERPVAQLRNVKIADAGDAAGDLNPFLEWCAAHRVALCSCRLPQSRRREAMFLEAHGFRFIELNYRPELTTLQDLRIEDSGIRIEHAGDGDRGLLADMCAKAFDAGRFHQDPRLGAEAGNRRYRCWLEGAFDAEHQQVLKCVFDKCIIGFFVIESPNDEEVRWSLTALGSPWRGRGLGRRTWEAVLLYHQRAGVRCVRTSISSHNVAVMNLYVRLGWQFPPPLLTFHWCPNDAPLTTWTGG